MLLPVLTRNLNRESWTKDLVTFYFNIAGLTEKSDFFRGEGVHKLKKRVGGKLDSFQI